jgi:hypothetical protein
MYVEEKKNGEALMRDVLEWAKKRDPKEQYNWSNSDTCACARYAKEKGLFKEWRARDEHSAWVALNDIACPHDPCWLDLPLKLVGTMGDFASQLEKALA